MRRAGKVDGIQRKTVDYLRGLGWGVHVASAYGEDFPDLVVACERFTALVELKDGSQPRHKTRLSLGQALFHAYWPGVVIMALSKEDAAQQLLAEMRGWKVDERRNDP